MCAAPLQEPPLPVWSQLFDRRPAEPFTMADLDLLPESGGYRFELLDGALIVTPGPNVAHQRLTRLLFRVLDAGCPDGIEVFFAPLDARLTSQRLLQPDILVLRTADLTDPARVVAAPLLIVEVASPSTALYDRTAKLAAYEEWGVPAYWLARPERGEVTLLELDRTGRYREAATVTAGTSYDATRPFPVTISLPAAEG